jgi:hypothetical protein
VILSGPRREKEELKFEFMDALVPRIPQKSRKERDHANAGAVTILVENRQIAEKSGRHPCW